MLDQSKVSMDLSGKVAIVTGGHRGIGRAISLGLAKFGANIVIADIVDETKIKKVTDEIENIGRRALAVRTDVTKKKDVEEMVQKSMKKFGKIDILVNNAGILRYRPFIEMTEDEWDEVMSVNVKGVFLCPQAVGKIMIKRRKGKIINVASTHGHVGTSSGLVAYCVSKGGVIQLTKALALEWAKYNINVNAISPTTTKTALFGTRLDKEWVEKQIDKIPINRMLEPIDVVGAAVFLASESSNAVTGHSLIVDGGFLAK